MTDSSIISAEDKRDQFEALALPFTKSIYNTALRLTHRPEDASDLVQETCLRAYRTFSNFTPGTNCKAWLFTIMYGRELEALRWTKRFSQQQYAAEAVPAKLEENILAALNLEDRRSGLGTVFPWSWWPQPRAILAYGLLLFVAIALVLSYFILRVPSEKSPELASQPKVSITPETSKSESTSKPELASPPALSSKPLMSAKPKLPSKPKLFTKPKLVAKPALPSQVARDYRNYKGEKLRLMLETEDVREMEEFFSEAGIPFRTRVFDLEMMDYRLAGGRVHQLINRQSALFVYRGKGNKIVVCQMYPGQVTKLPAGAVRRENKGIQFYIYRVNGMTVAFWQEGAVTCVLTSDIDPEEVIQLAFAKAMKI